MKDLKIYIFAFIFALLFASIYSSAVTNTTAVAAAASTTTLAPESSNTNETQDEPHVYYVCGGETISASSNAICYCSGTYLGCYNYSWKKMKAFQSANFVTDNYYSIERVYISNQNFGILKKNETLPAFAENIKSIELSSNAISDIENGTFDKFNQLETLKISGNKLKNLSSGVLTEKLGKTLTTLRLNEYQLSVTSIDFKYMTNLNTLDLDNNNYIDKVIASSTWTFPKSLSNLTTLILNYCNITNISENAFENLSSLTILRLRHNPITIYPKAVNSISTLQELDLSYSIINILNQTMMGKNEHLSSLIIHSSEISKIEDCTFCEFSNLTKLHLYKNPKLSFIDENAFGYAKNETVSKLKSFSLEYCNFTVIPEKLLNWHNVGEFGIVGNPFNCTCEMSWLIDDILNPYHTMNLGRIADSYPEETLVCKTPQKYGNLAFYKINKNYCKSEKHENGQSSETSFFIGFLIVAGLIFFVFAVPLCRYLLRLRKQKTLFNYSENKVNEDFDNNA